MGCGGLMGFSAFVFLALLVREEFPEIQVRREYHAEREGRGGGESTFRRVC